MDCQVSPAGSSSSAPLGEPLIVRPVAGIVRLVRYEKKTTFEDVGTLITFGPPKVSWYVDGEVRHTTHLTAEVRWGVDGEIELDFGEGLVVNVRNLVRYQRAYVVAEE